MIHDRGFGLQMHQMFKEDLGSAREVPLADLEKETVSDQMEQWFAGEILKDLL